jgi:hypothetical protein
MVSAATESISFDACAFHFYFEQQMTPEHGPSVRAYTDQMYSVGRKDLFLVAACDGWLLFEAGPCAC